MALRGILVVLLVSIIFCPGTSYAAEIDGPANIRLSPKGVPVIALNDGTPVHVVSSEADWYRIRLWFVVENSVLEPGGTVPKNTVIKDTNGKEIGKTLAAVTPASSSDYSYDILFQIDAFTFRNNIKPELVVEEYRIAKDKDELTEEKECFELACVPPAILAKRDKWRNAGKGAPEEPKPEKAKSANDVPQLIYPNTSDIRKYRLWGGEVEMKPIEIHLRGKCVYKGSLTNNPFEDSVKGLYVHDGQWIFESIEPDIKDGEVSGYYGAVVLDGVKLNARYGYREVFHYVIIKDKPFFFFSEKSGGVKMNYAGKILPMRYDSVLRNPCCSDAAFNAEWNDNMIWFYAMRDGALYYVEAGVY